MKLLHSRRIVVAGMLILAMTACKKNNFDVPTDGQITNLPGAGPKPEPNTIDTSLIKGWWRWKDTLHNYRGQYFGPDHFYVRDTGTDLAGYFTWPEWWISNDTLFIGRKSNVTQKSRIIKLTKDS